jgi:hypothetical protein
MITNCQPDVTAVAINTGSGLRKNLLTCTGFYPLRQKAGEGRPKGEQTKLVRAVYVFFVVSGWPAGQ